MMLKLCHLWPLGSFSVGVHACLAYRHHSELSYIPGSTRCRRLVLNILFSLLHVWERFFLLNNAINDGNKFSEAIFENGLSIYEVIRIFKGHPIFLTDNLIRLDNSLKKSNIGIHVQSLNIPDKLNRFITLEHITEGNLKYVLHFTTD